MSTDPEWLSDLDEGIRYAVRVLDRHGVETYESCQGLVPRRTAGLSVNTKTERRIKVNDGDSWLYRLRKRIALGVQNWMALDLWMALGHDSARAPREPFFGWADMLAEVRQSGMRYAITVCDACRRGGCKGHPAAEAIERYGLPPERDLIEPLVQERPSRSYSPNARPLTRLGIVDLQDSQPATLIDLDGADAWIRLEVRRVAPEVPAGAVDRICEAIALALRERSGADRYV